MADDGVKISALTEVLTEPATGEIVASVVGGVTYKRDIGKRLPSTMQKSALAGYGGTPSGTNPYATQTGATALAATAARPLSDLSRVMRINGDGVPTFPDNVAGRAYWNDIWPTVDSFTGINCSVSVSGEALVATATSSSAFSVRKTGMSFTSRLVRIKFSSFTRTGIYVLRYHISSTLYQDTTFTVVPSKMIYDVYLLTPGTYVSVDVFCSVAGSPGDSFSIDALYIGSGLYDTPVYDKACCNRFTNNGVLPVKGNRGLALSFNGNQWLEADNPVIGTTGTISFKLKNVTSGIILWNESYGSAGLDVYYSLGKLFTRFSHPGGITLMEAIVASDGTFSLVIQPANSKMYRNGVEVSTLDFSNVTKGTNNLLIGKEINGSHLVGTIEDILYDTRIWTQDDAIRYHNGDDAVDSQQKAITNVPNAIKVCDSKGNIRQPGLPVYADNTAALAGGLVASEPYRTSTGVLMVVY